MTQRTWPARTLLAASAAKLLLAAFFLTIPIAASWAQGTPSPGDLVINEVLHDGSTNEDANGDGRIDADEDEFVELVNVSGSTLDVSGLTLSDLQFPVRHTFPAGTVLSPLCAVVVFGGGSPTGSFGGAIVQTASTGLLGLDDFGDTVTLKDGVTEIDSFAYGFAGCEGSDQSLTLEPELTGTCVPHTTASGSGGLIFSPGTCVDGSAFGSCTDELFADGFESGNTSAWSAEVP